MKKGIKAEQRVEASLRSSGAKVTPSKGSRTSADGKAEWDSGKQWLYQVKYSATRKPASLNPNERTALLARAKRNNATPVRAAVTPDKIKYFSVKTGRKLKP